MSGPKNSNVIEFEILEKKLDSANVKINLGQILGSRISNEERKGLKITNNET